MIEINEIFSDSDKRIALWCESVVDTSDLAALAENIIISHVDLISVVPEMVPDMWVYLEKSPIKILTRYDFPKKNIDNDIGDLVKNIANICKRGADGVQIFLKMDNLEDFVEKILPVRADLFFEKDLCVVLDICDIDITRMDMIFDKLHQIGANAFMLTLNEDMGNRSDFVGRIYGMLKDWDFNGELHFYLNNNYDRIDQVIRLIESERPELKDRVKFFMDF